MWFVLLEKPDVAGSVTKPRPQLMMADAYRLLHDVTNKHNLSVKLDLSANKKLVSLEFEYNEVTGRSYNVGQTKQFDLQDLVLCFFAPSANFRKNSFCPKVSDQLI